LDCAEVRQKNNVRCEVTDGEGVEEGGVEEHGPLAADAEGHPVLLGQGGEASVDVAGLCGAAGHARDAQGDAQGLAREGGGEVELVEGELGEALVEEVDLIEEGGLEAILDVLAGAQVEVVHLALSDVGDVLGVVVAQAGPRVGGVGGAGRP
jgi:hypothetical protein